MTPPPGRPPARTTLAFDKRRRNSRFHFLHRGGRPRRSVWWRAWLARLLPHTHGSAPVVPAPVPVSAVLAVGSEILSLTFDAPIDGENSTIDASQIQLIGAVDVLPGQSFIDVVAGVVRIQFDLPAQIPLEMTCALTSGLGVLVGANGMAVAPFSGLPVGIE